MKLLFGRGVGFSSKFAWNDYFVFRYFSWYSSEDDSDEDESSASTYDFYYIVEVYGFLFVI